MKALGVIAALLLLVGCVRDERPAPVATVQKSPPRNLPPVTLACEEAIGAGDEPSPERAVVLGVVALPVSHGSREVLQTVPAPTGGYWAKDGLEVRSGASFELIVPEEARGRTSIGWGDGDVETWEFTVPKCEAGREWLAFAGGYWVRETACVPLLVRTDGRAQRVTIGVGAPCPDQDLPSQPSDL